MHAFNVACISSIKNTKKKQFVKQIGSRVPCKDTEPSEATAISLKTNSIVPGSQLKNCLKQLYNIQRQCL